MKRAVILGFGESGEAAARLLLAEHCDVTVLDAGSGGAVAARAESLRRDGLAVRLLTGERAMVPDEAFDVAVVSPGVPTEHAWVRALRARGVDVMSELELAWRNCRTPVLAVTGSNGKSTVARFCGDALARAGMRVAVGANYGTPLSGMVQAGGCDWMVAEVSSFQLEHTQTFRPRIAILLNILPNHLDRHGDMARYTAAKMRIFQAQTAGDTAVVPHDLARDGAVALSASVTRVSFGSEPGADVTYADGWVLGAFSDGVRVDFRGSAFENPVLGPHAAAATAALARTGVTPASIEAAGRDFQPLPHRMCTVATLDGVTFIDDSKATNLASMCAAITMCRGLVRLIAGGRLKEKNLLYPKELLAKRVRSVYLIGEAAEAMASAWTDDVRCVRCGTMEAAVAVAWREAAASDTVLLSPGCASFDQFGGFAERGDVFVRLVEEIRKGEVQV